MTFWDNALQEHNKHASFRVQMWAYSREYAFTCECSGEKQEWRIDICHLKELVPKALLTVRRIFGFGPKAGDKLKKKQKKLADVKARALLHRYLTKEQRLELRATQGFTVQGSDNRAYHVTGGNTFVEYEGQRIALCAIPIEELPTLDVMLAQKIMIENDPEVFLRLAHARNTVTNDFYLSGGFILGDDVQPEKAKSTHLIELTPEQIENPREWVEARLGVVPIEEALEETKEQVEMHLV
jgi:hypothetical protein